MPATTCPAKGLKIRTIENSHDQGLHRLIQGVLKSYGLDKPGTAYFDPELAHLSSHYTREGSQYFVLVQGDQVIGGVGVYPLVEGVCELQKLYLDPRFRGQGLGELLLRRALGYAKLHYGSIYLETHSRLKEAVPLYEKMGFEFLKRPLLETDHSEMDIWMQKFF